VKSPCEHLDPASVGSSSFDSSQEFSTAISRRSKCRLGLIEGFYNLSPAEPIVGDEINDSCISTGGETFASYRFDAAGVYVSRLNPSSRIGGF